METQDGDLLLQSFEGKLFRYRDAPSRSNPSCAARISRGKIGITYDLREDYLRRGYTEEAAAEFDSIATIDAIEDDLAAFGYQSERVGDVRNLTARLTAGERWDLVFNIAEGCNGVAREVQVPAVLDAFRVPYTFSDPLVLALTLHKAMTKRVVRDLGIATPDYRITATVDLLLRDRAAYDAMATGANPDGDGRAADRIAAVVAQILDGKPPVL